MRRVGAFVVVPEKWHRQLWSGLHGYISSPAVNEANDAAVPIGCPGRMRALLPVPSACFCGPFYKVDRHSLSHQSHVALMLAKTEHFWALWAVSGVFDVSWR